MIHYSCDLCKQELDPARDLRYAVKMELSQVLDPESDDEIEGDRDYLQEMDELISDSELRELNSDLHRELHFDLCPKCYRKFVKNPLGRDVTQQFDFSQN